MNQPQAKERLHALDGLRGLAIILVFLNHITPTFLLKKFPILDYLGIFSSGVTGVTFLFILSGFLMAYLYPAPANEFTFLQKRYTRIFPLFLTMCTVMLLFFLFPSLLWFEKLGILFICAAITHILWVYGVKKIHNTTFSNAIFFTFFGIQFIVGGIYAFWIMRHPPIYFQQTSPMVKSLFILLTNATLTFPLGNYIPMLDGVYWSLAAEILFYILYPFVFVPCVFFVSQQKKAIRVFFLLSLMPLFAGFGILSHHVLVLSALQPALFYYFVTGITIGFIYKNHKEKITEFAIKFTGYFYFIPLLFLIGGFVIIHLLNSITTPLLAPWIRLVFAVPLTVIVASLLNKNTHLAKLLRSKFLVFIGTISYSLYLSHAAVIQILESVFHSQNVLQDCLFILVAFSASVGISTILFYLLERPYFLNRKQKTQTANHIYVPSQRWALIILTGISVVYILAVFVSFQSKYNFFSLVSSHSAQSIVIPNNGKNSQLVSMFTNPQVAIHITATEDNFGIFSLSLTHIKKQVVPGNQPMLLFNIQEEGNATSLAHVAYVLDEFRGEDFPFGFPVVTNSKNKNFLITLSLLHGRENDYLQLDTASVKSIYQPSKKAYLKNPATLASLFLTKMQTVLYTSLAQLTLLYIFPFIGIFFILQRKKIPFS